MKTAVLWIQSLASILRRLSLFKTFAALFILAMSAGAVQAQDRRLMVLDPQFYLNKYPDLAAAFGPTNVEAAKQHWLSFGIKEGRQSSFVFSLPAYQAKNPDILWDRNIRSYEAILNYYITQGYKETRDTTPLDSYFDMTADFDPDFYRQYYADIGRTFGNNFGGITRHWREFGSKEGRLPNRKAYGESLALGVDPEFYAGRYRDLRKVFGTNAMALVQHYQQHGRNEGRFAVPGAEFAFEAKGPSSAHGRQYMRKGDWLSTDQYLKSPSRAYVAVQQSDGNFCVYKTGSPEDPTYPGLNWCSRNVAAPTGQYFTIFQGDGNLCTYAGTGPADNKGFIACPSGPRNGDMVLVLQNDGNLVMYAGKTLSTTTGPAIWNIGYYKNPKESPIKWVENAANTVANGTVLAANTVANAAVLAANATAAGVTVAANATASGTTQLANTIASGTVMAANTVAKTTVDVANQTAQYATAVIDVMRNNCTAYSKFFPDPLAGMQQLTLLAQVINVAQKNDVTSEVLSCANEFKAGYYCQIPEEVVSLVSNVKSLAEVAKRSAENALTKECAASFALTAPPLYQVQAPLTCGAVKGMVDDSIKLTRCLVAAEKDGVLGRLIAESGQSAGNTVVSVAESCQAAGKMTLKIAKMVMTKQIPAGSNAAQVWSFFSKGALANKAGGETYQRLMALEACKGM